MNKLDLDKLEEKLDNALENETGESLNNWLKEKRETIDLSDEEIYKVSFKKESIDWHDGFIEGAKWYREQLKK